MAVVHINHGWCIAPMCAEPAFVRTLLSAGAEIASRSGVADRLLTAEDLARQRALRAAVLIDQRLRDARVRPDAHPSHAARPRSRPRHRRAPDAHDDGRRLRASPAPRPRPLRRAGTPTRMIADRESFTDLTVHLKRASD